MGTTECNTCVYYDKRSWFCGFRMVKILKEIGEEKKEKTHDNGQNNTKSIDEIV